MSNDNKALSEEEIQTIIKRLNKLKVNKPCPRCGYEDFYVDRNLVAFQLQLDQKKFVVGGPSIPSIVTICKRCGYFAFHALGTMGFLKEGEVIIE